MANSSYRGDETLLGKEKVRQESLFRPQRRETRVSRELARLKGIVDFGWLREAVKDKFAEGGRPSIAPEVLGAMLLLGFWFDIASDRELCEECEDRLSFREFIGLSDDDEVPVHSSLTHWRKRLGREVFRRFLQESIDAAVDAGLSPGRCRLFDSSLVKAQADACSPARVNLDPVVDANNYLDALGEWEEPEENEKTDDEDTSGPPDEPKERSRKSKAGKRKHGGRLKRNKRKIKARKVLPVNSHDVDARYLTNRRGRADFFHRCHFEFDSKTGLVMNADAAHVPEPDKMVEFLENESYPFDTVGGDTGYFSVKSQKKLKEKGITSFISMRDNSNSGRAFGIDAFVYVPERDEYLCPQGKALTYQGKSCDGEKRYATARGSCEGCDLREYCFQSTRKGSRRQLTFCAGRELIDEARKRNQRHRYRRVMKKRSIICEGGIGTMKNHCGLRRARWLGEEGMAIQAMMAGAVLNLKKTLKHLDKLGKGVTGLVKDAFTSVIGVLRGENEQQWQSLPSAA